MTDKELKIENSQRLDKVALFVLPAATVVLGLVVQHREVSTAFWVLVALSVFAAASSLFFGGVGVSRLRRAKTEGPSFFNFQAIACIIAFLLLAASYIAIGAPKESRFAQDIRGLQEDVTEHGATLAEVAESLAALQEDLEASEGTLESFAERQRVLEGRIDKLSNCCGTRK